MTTTPEGVVLPVGEVILEPIPYARFSLGENPVHLLDGRQRRHWRHYLLGGVAGGDPSRPDGGGLAGGLAGRLGAGGELEGVADLVRRRPKSCWWPGVVTWMLVLAACSGLRRRAALAAPTSWDDLACSGLRRVAQPSSATPVWYIVEWRRKQQLGLLAWQRWLLRGWRNAMRSPGGRGSAV